MKYIVSFYLWVVGFFYFNSFLIFALIVSFLFPASKYDPWIKKLLRFFFKILRVPVDVEGAEKVDPKKTYLFMANHVSLFDVPLLGGFIPGFVRGVESERRNLWFFYGWVMGRIGNVSIERDNIHGSIQSIRRTGKILKEGKSMIILPEGHRTLDGKLGEFKKLPFFLAKQAEKEIVPIGLSGLYYLNRKGSLIIRPTTLKVKFGNIISVDKIQSVSTTELRILIQEKIQGLIERP